MVSILSDVSVMTEITGESRKLAPAVERFDPKVGAVALARLAEMQAFIETLNRWYDQMLGVPPAKIMSLINLGARVVDCLSFGRGKRAREG